MQSVLDAVAERLMTQNESLIRIPEICEATGVNYGSVYHHFGSRDGVIDAAYNMIFAELIQRDIEIIKQVSDSAQNLEEYLTSMGPIVESFATGEGRKERRALRLRIVSAAMTRPELRILIGMTQAQMTNELLRLVESGQERGFVRRDMTARSIAVLLQIVVFGRTLDDVSISPIDDTEWELSMAALFSSLLNLS